MSDDGGTPTESGEATDRTRLDPAEAFEILGNEERIRVLRSLVETSADRLSFSELRETVGSTDSGRFNYHLQRLVGHFVERDDDGYSLRYPGAKVAHAVLAGTFNERAHMPPTPIEGRCYECDDEVLVAEYVEEILTIRCGDCGNLVVSVPFPPGAVSSRDPEDVADAFDRWSSFQADLAAGGVCPECASEMTGSVMSDVPDTLDHEVLAAFECTVCRRRAVTSFGGVALHHPEVLAFHHQRNAYPRTRPYWTVEQLVTDRHTDVVSEDPWRIEVTFHAGGDVLTVTLDGNAAVIDLGEE